MRVYIHTKCLSNGRNKFVDGVDGIKYIVCILFI